MACLLLLTRSTRTGAAMQKSTAPNNSFDSQVRETLPSLSGLSVRSQIRWNA